MHARAYPILPPRVQQTRLLAGIWIAICFWLTLATTLVGADDTPKKESSDMQTATLGGGCFWCTEAVFQQLRGVHNVVSGYAGGAVTNPTYEQVCTGITGHAEVVQITFDPEVISYETLLEVFWASHDPTTLNRQGNDVGTQYRSVIFVHSPEQRRVAEDQRDKLHAAGRLSGSIVTEISEAATFYPAEDYHQNFFAKNPRQAYCAAIIRPKVKKVRNKFGEALKASASDAR